MEVWDHDHRRNLRYFFLAAREVAAIQSEHVLVTMKHFAAYTQEQGRLGDSPTGERPAVNQIVSERALREIMAKT